MFIIICNNKTARSLPKWGAKALSYYQCSSTLTKGSQMKHTQTLEMGLQLIKCPFLKSFLRDNCLRVSEGFIYPPSDVSTIRLGNVDHYLYFSNFLNCVPVPNKLQHSWTGVGWIQRAYTVYIGIDNFTHALKTINPFTITLFVCPHPLSLPLSQFDVPVR